MISTTIGSLLLSSTCVAALAFAPDALADGGLSSLATLRIPFLILSVAAIAGTLGFGWFCYTTFHRWSGPERRAKSLMIFRVLGATGLLAAASVTDFNRYVLVDAALEGEVILRAQQENRYFEFSNGTAFVAMSGDVYYLKRGDSLVARAVPGLPERATLYAIETVGDPKRFFLERKRGSIKQLWLPVWRTEKNRRQLKTLAGGRIVEAKLSRDAWLKIRRGW